MNLYETKIARMYLGHGMHYKTILVHAPNVQSAGKELKKHYAEWTQMEKWRLLTSRTRLFQSGDTFCA